MKVVSNNTGKVVSCDKLVQFKIVMERLDAIIEGLNATKTENEKKFILKDCVQAGEDKGYIIKISHDLVHIAMEEGLFTANPTIGISGIANLLHVGPFVGNTTYNVINWSGYRPFNERG